MRVLVFFILCFFYSTSLFAQENDFSTELELQDDSVLEAYRPVEKAYLQLRCIGTTSMKNKYPQKEKEVYRLHVEIDKNAIIPKLDAFKVQHKQSFKQLTQKCNQARRLATDTSGLTSEVFPGWNSEDGYQRVELGVAVVYSDQSCQNSGSPCESNADCCNSMMGAGCNSETKTCKDLAVAEENKEVLHY